MSTTLWMSHLGSRAQARPASGEIPSQSSPAKCLLNSRPTKTYSKIINADGLTSSFWGVICFHSNRWPQKAWKQGMPRAWNGFVACGWGLVRNMVEEAVASDELPWMSGCSVCLLLRFSWNGPLGLAHPDHLWPTPLEQGGPEWWPSALGEHARRASPRSKPVACTCQRSLWSPHRWQGLVLSQALSLQGCWEDQASPGLI